MNLRRYVPDVRDVRVLIVEDELALRRLLCLNLELAGGFDHSDPSGDVSWRRILNGLDDVLRTWSGGA